MRTELKIFFGVWILGLSLLAVLYPKFGHETFTWAGEDSAQYETLATNIVGGHGFSIRTHEPYMPSPSRVPGYPLVLALSKFIFDSVVPVMVLQTAMLGFLTVLIFKIARRFLDKSFSIAAALITGIHPYFLFLSLSLMTEIFFTVALLGSLLFLLKYFDEHAMRFAGYSGLLLGIATLFRPTTQMLVVVWIGVVLAEGLLNRSVFRKNIFTAAVCAAIFVGVLAPWLIRNKVQFDRWGLVSANAYGFYVATPVQIVALKEGISRGEARQKLMGDFKEAFGDKLAPDADYPDALAFDKFEYTDWFAERNSKIIKENFGIFMKAVLVAVPEFLTKNDWLHPFEKYEIVRPEYQPLRPLYRYWAEDGVVSAAKEIINRFSCGASCLLSFGLVAAGRVFYLLVFIFSVLGSVLLIRDPKTRLPAAALILLVVYFGAAHLILTASAGHERYRLPAVPVMLTLALFGLRYLCILVRNALLKKRLS